MLLASSRQRPGMLLNILQCSGQSPTMSTMAPNVNGAEVEKPCHSEWQKPKMPSQLPKCICHICLNSINQSKLHDHVQSHLNQAVYPSSFPWKFFEVHGHMSSAGGLDFTPKPSPLSPGSGLTNNTPLPLRISARSKWMMSYIL